MKRKLPEATGFMVFCVVIAFIGLLVAGALY